MSEKTFSEQLFDLGLEAGKFIIEFMKGKEQFKPAHRSWYLLRHPSGCILFKDFDYVKLEDVDISVLCKVADHLKTVTQDETAKSVSD